MFENSNSQINILKNYLITLEFHVKNLLFPNFKNIKGILKAENKQNIVHSLTYEGNLIMKSYVCKEIIFLFFYQLIY